MKNNSKINVVKTLISGWRETRSLTIDWINFYSIKKLQQKLPRVGLNTFVKHLIEMLEVQKSYVNVSYGEKLNFLEIGKSLPNPSVMTKKFLIEKLKFEDDRLYKTINNIKDWNKPVELFNKKYPLYYVIELLIRHETLHHGQFIAFGYSMKLKFPKYWKIVWALP